LEGGHPSDLLVVIDVSNGGLEDISNEMAKFSGTKHQTPCKLVFLADLKTTSGDLRRFSELGCDLVLRKPMHGSRLYAILRTLRELQASDAQNPAQVGPAEVAGTSHQPELPGILLQDVQGTPAATEVEAQRLKTENDKPLAGMHVLLAEDSLVLQAIQRRMLSQLGATVKLAVDGSEALKLYKEALEQAIVSEDDTKQLPYDVIFMDCEVCSIKIRYYHFILIE
jgi:DNA-binding response OmpR family regulator